MQHHVALVASDAWRNFSPLPIGGEVLSQKTKSGGSSFLARQQPQWGE